MTEHDLLNAIRLAASRHGARLFRNNVAKGWVGRLISHRAGTVVLADARPLHAGLCTGSSDLIGWDAVGRFLAVEGKVGRTRTTDDQAAFLAAVEAAGGVAVLARSVEDVVSRLGPVTTQKLCVSPDGCHCITAALDRDCPHWR